MIYFMQNRFYSNINGKLNYGELILKGKSKQEILISYYVILQWRIMNYLE